MRGTVTRWDDEEGWGVVTRADDGAEVWAHYSVIEMGGYRRLPAGAEVELDVEAFPQDGYASRATRIVPR